MKKPLPSPQLLSKKNGFALIATLSIMSLLVMLVVGMLSLAKVETRSATQQKYVMEARANARMALMVALGELQESVGPDTRVTANSRILGEDTKNHSLVGAWRSIGADATQRWDAEQAVSHFKQSYGSKERGGRFLKWLVSGDDVQRASIDFPNQNVVRPVVLVGDASLRGLSPSERAKQKVSASKVSIGNNRGSYAWWVGDEGQKARVNLETADSETEYVKLASSVAPATWGVQSITMLKGVAEENLARSITDASVDLSAEAASSRHFFDLTTHSRSLLTDTSFGGLKEDLSLLTEKSSLPVDLENKAIATGLCQWDALYAYCRLYKPHDAGGILKWQGQSPVVFLGGGFQSIKDESGKTRRYLPVTTKTQVLMSHYTVPSANASAPGTYEVRASIDKQTEIWNPLNLPFELEQNTNYHMKWWTMPFGMKFSVNGQAWKGSVWNSTIDSRSLRWNIFSGGDRKAYFRFDGEENRLAAGEVRFFSDSIESGDPVDRDTQARRFFPTEGFALTGGLYSHDVGHYTSYNDLGQPGYSAQRPPVLRVGPTDTIEPELKYYPWTQTYGRRHLVDFWLTNDTSDGGYFGVGQISSSGAEDKIHHTTDEILIDEYDTGFTATEVSGIENKKPFALVGMRLRTERSLAGSSGYTASERARTMQYLYGSMNLPNLQVHNDNAMVLAFSPYEYFMQPIEGDVDSISNFVSVPADGDSSNKGFIGSASDSNGVSFVAQKEVPVAPLVSLGQLQHAPLGEVLHRSSDYHPNVNNAMGNAFESPFVEPTMVVRNEGIAPQDGSIQTLYDKSWVANYTLWDRYFFSGIAPESALASSPRSQLAVLEEFADHSHALPNARLVAEPTISEMVDVLGSDQDYQKVAKYVTSEGGFNVNSTSVVAWRAFLGSLDGRSLLYMDSEHPADGTEASSVQEARALENGAVAVSRFTLPIGGAADTTGADFIEDRWKGARQLSDAQLDALAHSMVDEVRKRGPFLSLSELVNRQLSSSEAGEKGALQAAIDSTDMNDSFTGATGTSEMVELASVAELDVSGSLANPDAAEGYNGVAATGYVTQADLLMSMAPHITVRSDTFKVRAYGEATDASGVVKSEAWCEAIVQRGNAYSDPNDAADTVLFDSQGNKIPEAITPQNEKYGRKLNIVSFRWLAANEI